MTNEKIKRMFDACYQAKRIRDSGRKLRFSSSCTFALASALMSPSGVMPSYIQYLDVIRKLEGQGTGVKVSDISDALNLPRPGVTRTIKEMEKKGYICKISSPDDGRVTYISATEEGEELSKKYDEYYFNDLRADLSDITEEEADGMIRTIEKFYKIMCERREHFDK